MAEKENRESSYRRGYDTTWERARKMYLSEHPLCENSEAAKKIKIASLVHHIKPVEDYPELRLDPENFMSLCRDCHEIEHERKAGKINVDQDGFPLDPEHNWNQEKKIG